MGSIASDNQGNIALGFSASSSSINPQIRYAGRLATDPLNTLSGEQHLFDGTGSQSATTNRWGDYSDVTVDPVDDCTFYYTNEYYTTTTSFNWRTQIGYFRFTQCTAAQNGTAHFVVTACNGGAAISNASVSIDSRPYGATLSNGTYDAVLTPGSHSYSVSKAGVGSQTGNVTITNGQTTNVNVCLGGSPSPTPTPTSTPTATIPPSPTPTATVAPSPTPTATATTTPTPTPAQITLSAPAARCVESIPWTSRGTGRLQATSIFIATDRFSGPCLTTGSYTDRTGQKGHATFTYKVCNAGTNTCSNQATVIF